jgi:hypothetical protein
MFGGPVSKAKGTKILKELELGCADCQDTWKAETFAKHSEEEWHCFECNSIYEIDYNVPFERHYRNHNWNSRDLKGRCKMLKSKQFKCEVCEFVYPWFPHSIKTYESIYGGRVELMTCLRCSGQIGAKPQEQKGWRHAPLWAWGLLPANVALQYFIIFPTLGMDMNIGGFLSSAAVPAWLIYSWKEKL